MTNSEGPTTWADVLDEVEQMTQRVRSMRVEVAATQADLRGDFPPDPFDDDDDRDM
jgi:hypothetical protein